MSQWELMPAMGISSSGLEAERLRMEVAANNLANAHSSRDADGQVYQRRQVVFSSVLNESLRSDSENLGGVQVDDIVTTDRPPVRTYAPYHPNADADGMIEKANISPLEEMIDMITATRAYEANLSALKQSSDMAKQTIQLGR